MKLRVGTRASPLAVAQARLAMSTFGPEVEWELVEIRSIGDKIADRPLRDVGGKGLFVRELDAALLEGHVDCAVHSLKDVPSALAEGIAVAAYVARGDPRDVFVGARAATLDELAPGARVGTSSPRREALLRGLRSDLDIDLVRGSIGTRLGKVRAGELDATFLARAGLDRLAVDLDGLHTSALDPSRFVPSPGQGTLAVMRRSRSAGAAERLDRWDHAPTRAVSEAERSFARTFGGGCHLPLGAFAQFRQYRLELLGFVASLDGSEVLRESLEGAAENAEELGAELGRLLIERGAGRLVAEPGPAT